MKKLIILALLTSTAMAAPTKDYDNYTEETTASEVLVVNTTEHTIDVAVGLHSDSHPTEDATHVTLKPSERKAVSYTSKVRTMFTNAVSVAIAGKEDRISAAIFSGDKDFYVSVDEELLSGLYIKARSPSPPRRKRSPSPYEYSH